MRRDCWAIRGLRSTKPSTSPTGTAFVLRSTPSKPEIESCPDFSIEIRAEKDRHQARKTHQNEEIPALHDMLEPDIDGEARCQGFIGEFRRQRELE